MKPMLLGDRIWDLSQDFQSKPTVYQPE